MRPSQLPTLAEHFGWGRHPFADTRALSAPWLSAGDERLLTSIRSMIWHGKSLGLCGPSGTGKSTLVHHLSAELDPRHYRPIWIHYGGLNRAGLLRAVAHRLGVDPRGRSVPLLLRIQEQILQPGTAGTGGFPVLILDDAHLAERESLMDLCSLLTCPERRTAAASLVLIGDGLLRQQLGLNVMAPVRGRLIGPFSLAPLTEAETADFIAHRLGQAKAPPGLFDDDALEMIAAGCHGNRREIMNLATLLLEEAYVRREKVVTAQTVIHCECLENPGET